MNAHQDDPWVIKDIKRIILCLEIAMWEGKEPVDNIFYKDYHLKSGP